MFKTAIMLYLLSIFSISCNTEQNPSTEVQKIYKIQNTTSSLSGAISENKPSVEEHNIPSSPLRVTLDEMNQVESTPATILTITAVNISEEDLVTQAIVSVSGLLQYREFLILSQKRIKIGESKSWTVPIAQLPIESTKTITQLGAGVKYKKENGDIFTGVATTPEYYYLTDESLDTINLFNEEQFHKIYKGKSRPNRDRSVTTEALGKLKKNNGTSEIITTESIGLQVLNSEGVEVGKIVEEYEFDPRYNEEEE